ncbi:MAG: CGNR zinc finger domain-containing protein [Chloroflexi bacterium]|nr:CGNR zinc finger domain-containing protein [Chloroflexota bacterium]
MEDEHAAVAGCGPALACAGLLQVGKVRGFVLWPVMRSAAELLTSDLASRVGQCQDDRGCGWLFIDTSRNHTRRWCAMGDCGNRAKARRHYLRTQKIRAEGAVEQAAKT